MMMMETELQLSDARPPRRCLLGLQARRTSQKSRRSKFSSGLSREMQSVLNGDRSLNGDVCLNVDVCLYADVCSVCQHLSTGLV